LILPAQADAQALRGKGRHGAQALDGFSPESYKVIRETLEDLDKAPS